ncbi:endoglucanase A precursor [Rhizodiscina lignyota]|uniref:Endoglucanase A n=1 Tax=Rhizodiscina lignyota TaxID=1504668 RepID=A0A9P4I5C0_9PEZI|nr:endoglucanase A precursor [Rhizodiscina lignyota]
MKSSILLLSCLSALAAASPTRTLQKRADSCGQYDTIQTGDYTVYQNLWGESSATSGSQCSGVDSLSGSTLAWHTTWTWAGGQGQVKSFANAGLTMSAVQLSNLGSVSTTWSWSYTGSDIVADVAYDMFTSSSPGGSDEYEVMIWLAALGGAGPISSTGSPIDTPTVAGHSWKLYNGMNGAMNVYSFVTSGDSIEDFSADIADFFTYLESEQSMPSSQYLLSIQAGTEPFSGTDAKLTTTAYSVALADGDSASSNTTSAATASSSGAASSSISAAPTTAVAAAAASTSSTGACKRKAR